MKTGEINQRLAIVTLLVMTVQFLWLEGYKVSNVKVAFMLLLFSLFGEELLSQKHSFFLHCFLL